MTKPNPEEKYLVRYELEHRGTEAGTGSFAPVPVGQVTFENGLAYLRNHPNDEFLHRYMLDMMGTLGPNLAAQLVEKGLEGDPVLAALLYEGCYLIPRFHTLLEKYEEEDLASLAEYTPLIYIRWIVNRDLKKNLNGGTATENWISMFSENITKHQPLTPPDMMKETIPYPVDTIKHWEEKATSMHQLDLKNDMTPQEKWGRSPGETVRWASERLEAIGLQKSAEYPNPASIYPTGLLAKWQMDIQTTTGRHAIHLTGVQTSYGKGLTPEKAKASCLMEICERVSSFAGFKENSTLGYKNGHDLRLLRLQDFENQGMAALDPNTLHLEVPYENEPLYWIAGERIDTKGSGPVYIPAQLVFLFCNLDEVALSDGLPSTGLASGNTIAEARLNALLEVIERDAERVMPYLPNRCFSLETADPLVQEVLLGAQKQGLQVQFLDITTEFGIPCYKAFMQTPNGEILKGCSAHLDGKRAAVSALLEVPYHRSWFQPVPGPAAAQTTRLENLPNYSCGDAEKDLERLERLLAVNGYSPIYVDLTRKDLDIPVVKALVPGLECFAEFDRFSRLSLRQFGHYLKANR